MNASVSAILRDCYGITAKPGAKVKCPFCHHKTFSLKRDDLLGKCFHPACGRFITPNQGDGQSSQSLANVLAVIYHDFHQALLSLKEAPYRNAYNYLVTERQIHPRVVADSMLGAVPSGGYDVEGECSAFQLPYIAHERTKFGSFNFLGSVKVLTRMHPFHT